MEKAVYTGIIVSHKELLDNLYAHNPTIVRLGRLDKLTPTNYISVGFRGETEGHEKFYGTKITLKIVGYGRDDDNEGLRVEIHPTGNKELDNILKKVTDPVISLSTSATGLAKNAKSLRYWALFNPFFITGVYSGINSKGHVISPEGGEKN